MKEYIGYKIGDRVTIEFEGLRISGVLKKIKNGLGKFLFFALVCLRLLFFQGF